MFLSLTITFFRVSLLVILACLLLSVAEADDDNALRNEMRRCISLADDDARLTCFDQLANDVSQTSESPAESIEPESSDTRCRLQANENTYGFPGSSNAFGTRVTFETPIGWHFCTLIGYFLDLRRVDCQEGLICSRSPVMATLVQGKVDYRLLNRLSDLVICSRCFRVGTITPVPQVISARHALKNVCSACRTASQRPTASGQHNFRHKVASLLRLRS